MKKIILIALLLLSSSISAEIFEHNTDEKSKYEFDFELSTKNEWMAERLELFRSSRATVEEIDAEVAILDKNQTLVFPDDVMIAYADGQLHEPIVSQTKEDDNSSMLDDISNWFSSPFGEEEVTQKMQAQEDTKETPQKDDKEEPGFFSSLFGSDDEVTKETPQKDEKEEEGFFSSIFGSDEKVTNEEAK